MLTTENKLNQIHQELSMDILDHPNDEITLRGVLLSKQEAQELLLHLEARLNQVSLAPSHNAKVRSFLSQL
ncbi:hypothetical protein [Lactococcus garvieae]